MTILQREFETATVTVDTDRGTASITKKAAPPPPPPDNPPTIRITKPARAGKRFKSQLTIQFEASLDTRRIVILADAVTLADWTWVAGPTTTSGSKPGTYLWKPGKKVKPGKHKIEVRAYDSAGQSAVASTWVKRV